MSMVERVDELGMVDEKLELRGICSACTVPVLALGLALIITLLLALISSPPHSLRLRSTSILISLLILSPFPRPLVADVGGGTCV